ncbi:hypothetical protein AAG906_033564 [Vitis piasezkii]
MSTPNKISSVIPVFNGEHYHIWAVKMRFYLRSQGLWNVLMRRKNSRKTKPSPAYIQDLQTTSSPKSWTWKHLNRLLTLKREFELMKMKDNESVKDYSSRLMDVVNQMRLLGEAFIDQKVVEKIMVSVPQKFEAKIFAIEESCDLQSLTIAELTIKLHAGAKGLNVR